MKFNLQFFLSFVPVVSRRSSVHILQHVFLKHFCTGIVPLLLRSCSTRGSPRSPGWSLQYRHPHHRHAGGWVGGPPVRSTYNACRGHHGKAFVPGSSVAYQQRLHRPRDIRYCSVLTLCPRTRSLAPATLACHTTTARPMVPHRHPTALPPCLAIFSSTLRPALTPRLHFLAIRLVQSLP